MGSGFSRASCFLSERPKRLELRSRATMSVSLTLRMMSASSSKSMGPWYGSMLSLERTTTWRAVRCARRGGGEGGEDGGGGRASSPNWRPIASMWRRWGIL